MVPDSMTLGNYVIGTGRPQLTITTLNRTKTGTNSTDSEKDNKQRHEWRSCRPENVTIRTD